jgi:hypothetical protein
MFWEDKFEMFRVVNGIEDGENSATGITNYVGLAILNKHIAAITYRYALHLV